MLARNLATVLLALGLWGIANAGSAQDDAAPEKDKSLIGRLDNLGKTLFGGILPAEKPKAKEKETVAPKVDSRPSIQKPSATAKPVGLKSPMKEEVVRDPADEADVPKPSTHRAGTLFAGSSDSPRARFENKSAAGDTEELMPENTPPAVSRKSDQTPKQVRRAPVDTSLLDDSETPETTQQHISVAETHKRTENTHTPTQDLSSSAAEQADLPSADEEETKTPAKPLHERLSTFRQSVFATSGAAKPHPQSNVATEKATEPVATKMAEEPATSMPTERVNVAQRVRIPVRVAETPAVEPVPKSTVNTPKELGGGLERNETVPLRVETAPGLVPPQAAAATGPLAIEQAQTTATPNSEGVLFARKGPILSVETLGPRRISVGKESTYEVSLTNSGEVAAEDLVVYVSLPEWAEVVGADVSTGDGQTNSSQAAGAVQWRVGHLDAKGCEHLTLRIVPRQNRPFDLAVRWESRPVGSQAMIEVQEPKLVLQLEGPREVLYGKKEVYRLKLANTGNGAAENVAIMLMPVGGGDNVPATHRLGSLAAGEEKVLDVELTARQAGNLTIQLDARADGGVHTELAEKVIVRRAGLKIDVEGPKMQFVGTAATYTVRVRNSGTAPARNIKLSAVLPAGTKYLSGIDDSHLDAATGRLDWTIETINPEVEHSFVVKCSLAAAGVCRVQVNATADDDLSTTAGAITRVESVANLSMEVRDPEGPVPVGDEATYEVRVRNRGTREAEGIEIFGYFSRGVEPTSAEGGPNRLGPGQVVFQPIPSLAPGAEVILKVHAKAEAAGNHVFRAEAHCRPLGARLVREATNLYYADASSIAQQPAKQSATEEPATDAARPITRPIQGEAMATPPRKQ